MKSIETKIGGYDFDVSQWDQHTAWVNIEINKEGPIIKLLPEDFSVLVDMLVSFKTNYLIKSGITRG